MAEQFSVQAVARIYNDFSSKFGIPRQSGIVSSLVSTIVLEPEFRNPDVYRGLSGYSHLWLLWQFSHAEKQGWSATVRPPKLGGNTRIGVFASRSPFRPNRIGLSSVKIENIELSSPDGPLLYVSGADLLNGTPILDIKPYLPYTDSHPDALGGYAVTPDTTLSVNIPPALLDMVPVHLQKGLCDLLAQDPRPGYQADQDRIYGLSFGGFEIRFTVNGDTLTVHEIT
ncbi:MAG: tRNA (N6-threonylcarbamoyladenosine(37)-N6)-methyltransferase TrmO [Clostridia bacterium]|nr:tRNA (N6-threonylcarbamoyladenosine(37)-N6)-methyltransferase TrmO [Clostridia bacterium]